jgi:hypothetical protein
VNSNTLRLAGAASALQNAKAVATGDNASVMEVASARLQNPAGGARCR